MEEVTLSSALSVSRRDNSSLEEWVAGLFDQLWSQVFAYLVVLTGDRAEAEEMTQECFLKLYRVLREGGAVEDPRPWLFRLAHNAAIDRSRVKETSARVSWPDWETILRARSDPGPDPEQALLQKERVHRVRAAMLRLTAQECQVLQLRSSGLRYREIADILGLGTTTVADALRRAIQKMKAESHV